MLIAWLCCAQVEVAPSQMGASAQRSAPSSMQEATGALTQRALPEGKPGQQQGPVDVSISPPGTPPSGEPQACALVKLHCFLLKMTCLLHWHAS